MFDLNSVKFLVDQYGSKLSALDDESAAEILVGFLTYLDPAKRARVVVKACAELLPDGEGSKENVLSYLWREGIPGRADSGD